MKVTNNHTDAAHLDIKRCHLPAVMEVQCPWCRKRWCIDFLGYEYLSYPKVNSPFRYTCHCSSCDHEWPVMLKLTMTLEVTEGGRDAQG